MALNAPLRILVVGEFAAPQYDLAVSNAFEQLGCEVERFVVFDYVHGKTSWQRLQGRFLIGPAFWRMWLDLTAVSQQFRPDVVYFRRPTYFPAHVLRRLRTAPSTLLVEYMNDDPFGPDRNKHWWWHFRRALPEYDVHFVFRELNIPEFLDAGARHVELFWPYYVEALHYPHALSDDDFRKFSCDAVFAGHEEPDIRLDCFDALLEAGLDLRLYGAFYGYGAGRPFTRLLPTRYIGGCEYAKALQVANCALCFFSSRNRDTITFRIFEIPACGGVLVAERNADMEKLFADGEEAFLFTTPAELVNVVHRLKNDPALRTKVAEAGRRRVLMGGHEVKDRVRRVLDVVKQLR